MTHGSLPTHFTNRCNIEIGMMLKQLTAKRVTKSVRPTCVHLSASASSWSHHEVRPALLVGNSAACNHTAPSPYQWFVVNNDNNKKRSMTNFCHNDGDEKWKPTFFYINEMKSRIKMLRNDDDENQHTRTVTVVTKTKLLNYGTFCQCDLN